MPKTSREIGMEGRDQARRVLDEPDHIPQPPFDDNTFHTVGLEFNADAERQSLTSMEEFIIAQYEEELQEMHARGNKTRLHELVAQLLRRYATHPKTFYWKTFLQK